MESASAERVCITPSLVFARSNGVNSLPKTKVLVANLFKNQAPLFINTTNLSEYEGFEKTGRRLSEHILIGHVQRLEIIDLTTESFLYPLVDFETERCAGTGVS